MGMDFLDCCLRIEAAFGLAEGSLSMDHLDVPRTPGGTLMGITAGDLAQWVETELVMRGREVPCDVWPRVRACIAATVAVPEQEVMPASRLIEDLGFT